MIIPAIFIYSSKSEREACHSGIFFIFCFAFVIFLSFHKEPGQDYWIGG